MAGVLLFSNTNIAAVIKAKLYDRMMFWKYRLLAWMLKLNVAYYDAPHLVSNSEPGLVEKLIELHKTSKVEYVRSAWPNELRLSSWSLPRVDIQNPWPVILCLAHALSSQ